MKATMRCRVSAYLAHRRALGFRLRSEGYLLLGFERHDEVAATVALLPLCQRLEQADPLGHSRQRVVNSKLAEQLANLAPG